MNKLQSPLFLKIETQEQLNALSQALDMQYDMQDDMVLDDTVTSVSEVRTLATRSDQEIMANLTDRRKTTDRSIDMLLAINELRTSLESIID